MGAQAYTRTDGDDYTNDHFFTKTHQNPDPDYNAHGDEYTLADIYTHTRFYVYNHTYSHRHIHPKYHTFTHGHAGTPR
jgi:hypothetical protein